MRTTKTDNDAGHDETLPPRVARHAAGVYGFSQTHDPVRLADNAADLENPDGQGMSVAMTKHGT